MKLTMKGGEEVEGEEAEFYKMILQNEKGRTEKREEKPKTDAAAAAASAAANAAANRRKKLPPHAPPGRLQKNRGESESKVCEDSDSSWSDFDEEDEAERALEFSSTPRGGRGGEDEEESVGARMGGMELGGGGREGGGGGGGYGREVPEAPNPMDEVMGDDFGDSDVSSDSGPIAFKGRPASPPADKYSNHLAPREGGEESDEDDLDDISFGDEEDGGCGSVTFKSRVPGGGAGTGRGEGEGGGDESFGRLSDDEELMFDEDDNFIPEESRGPALSQATKQHEDDVDDIFAEYERRLAAKEEDSAKEEKEGALGREQGRRSRKKEQRVAVATGVEVGNVVSRSQFSSSLPSPLEFKRAEEAKGEGGGERRRKNKVGSREGGGNYATGNFGNAGNSSRTQTVRGSEPREGGGGSGGGGGGGGGVSERTKKEKEGFTFDMKSGKIIKNKGIGNGRAVGNPKGKDGAKFVF